MSQLPLSHSLLNLEEPEKGLNKEPCGRCLSSEPQETRELGGKALKTYLGCPAGAFCDGYSTLWGHRVRGERKGGDDLLH